MDVQRRVASVGCDVVLELHGRREDQLLLDGCARDNRGGFDLREVESRGRDELPVAVPERQLAVGGASEGLR